MSSMGFLGWVKAAVALEVGHLLFGLAVAAGLTLIFGIVFLMIWLSDVSARWKKRRERAEKAA